MITWTGAVGRLAALSFRRHLIFAAIAGAVAALGQAPVDLPWLGWLGFVGLAATILPLGTVRRAMWTGLVGGTAYFAVALNWIIEPFLVEPGQTGWMAPFALVFMAGGLALFWAAAAGLAVRLFATPWSRALGWAALLSLAEYARANVLTGFPWAHPGHIWIDSAGLVLAAWIGPHGLTLITLFSAALCAAALSRRSWLAVLGPAVLVVAGGIGGLIPAAPVVPLDAPIIRLIQPNAAQHLKWLPDMVPVFFRRSLQLTAAAPLDGIPELVVWPETSLPPILSRSEAWREQIALAAGSAHVVLGAQRFEGVRVRNSLVHLTSDGAIADVYDKHHLVPFGEYLPFADLLAGTGLRGLAANNLAGYEPGDGPTSIALPGLGRAFVMICYEAIFPSYIRAVGRPDWMLHITNDAWFGQLSGPYQHLALARLRAAEQGLPVLRSANTGVSAVIDARGQILASLELDVSGYLDARLPPPLPATIYSRSGDAPTLALIALLFAFAALRGRKTPPIDQRREPA